MAAKRIDSIEKAIKNSKDYSKRGNQLALESIKLVKKASVDILKKLDITIKELNDKNVNGSNGVELLVGQLDSIKKELSVLPDKMLDDIKCISKNTINITLFGRTMAGKSTLMEILTHGNGDSIGKGYQRTTRDVREYKYKGLAITDVPGIAAFEGIEDEEIAYNSAKKADLIFFLITDDAPQASEADCLRKILQLGKPVVCLVNIKANIDEKTSTKMFSRDVNKKMTEERLMEIKNQFLAFGTSYGQAWDMLKFEFVHLRAAFLAKSSDWNRDNDELLRLSRFEYVEKLIADEVTKNSGYYKIKAYIDTVVVPIMITADILIKQASENRDQSMVIEKKREDFERWLSKYKNRGKEQIEKDLKRLKSDIKREIPTFSENHYSDNNAGEKWMEIVKRFKIEEECGKILDQLAEECENKLKEIYREIAAELRFSSAISTESEIHMGPIVDGKRIWNWGITITTGVLSALALIGVPVVGWVALGVGIVGVLFSSLFKSKDQKIKEAREKLEEKINDNLDKQFKEINGKMIASFENELISKQIDPTFELFDEIIKAMKAVSEAQNSFASSLYDKQEDINSIMLKEVADYLHISYLRYEVIYVSRIPGTCMSLCVNNIPGKNIIEDIEALIKETVFAIEYTQDINDLLSRQIGIAKSKIKIEYDEQKNPVAIRINADSINPITVNRIKMAQQLSKLYIRR